MSKNKLDSNPVDHPKHYTTHWSGIEAIVFTEQLTGNLSNAFKYVYRHEEKWNPIEDLKKTLWYLSREEVRLEPFIGKRGSPDPTYNIEHLYVMWLDDRAALNENNIIYKIVGNPATNMDKALFYIWAQAFSYNTISYPIIKAKHYVNLILEEKQKQQTGGK